jgi:CNT family concentrative nucleoside transporter
MESKDLLLNLISLMGVYMLCLIAWMTSENRRNIPWDTIKWGLASQFLIGFLIFVIPPIRDLVILLNNALNFLMDASEAGGRFLFSSIFVPPGSERTVDLFDQTMNGVDLHKLVKIVPPKPGDPVQVPKAFFEMKTLNFGFIFAFRSLPQVIFFSAILGLLYRMNVIQPLVNFLAKLVNKTMNVSGAESLAGSANIFVGIESIIAIKPFLPTMTRSELCAILASCFGSISSSMLALYAGLLKTTFPAITGHLVSASILTIPACFVTAKLIVPEEGIPDTMGGVPQEKDNPDSPKPSHMDALIVGALDGVKMAVGIAAVLIAILGCVALINMTFTELANLATWEFKPEDGVITKGFKFVGMGVGKVFQFVSLDNIFGFFFFPLTILTGVSLDFAEIWTSSTLIGQRILQTSVPPYMELGKLSAKGLISDRAMLIVSYVLCGFAHIPSIGIFVGGLTNMIPERASEVSSIAWKSLWAATLGTLMTGCVAGIFYFGQGSALGK